MAGMEQLESYRGSCHCGRVQFEVRTRLDRVSECNCSICSRKGYLHHMVPPDRFRLLRGEDALETYTFGTGRARHQFCRQCGVAAFYRPRANPANYMINARCLEGVDLRRVERVAFDGAGWEARPDAPYRGIWNV
jgi:hypothetical protein